MSEQSRKALWRGRKANARGSGCSGWKVRFRTDQIGKKVMAVFVDIYGNEARVLIDAAEFGERKGTGDRKETKR